MLYFEDDDFFCFVALFYVMNPSWPIDDVFIINKFGHSTCAGTKKIFIA